MNRDELIRQSLRDALGDGGDGGDSDNDDLIDAIAASAMAEGGRRLTMRAKSHALWLLSAAAVLLALFTAQRARRERAQTEAAMLAWEGSWAI